ncbi:MAG: hypothetical protein KAX31_01610, partial [Thermoplasmata archaeon]|nr:hypothetical protein [Thermoplasmata archaeon]
TPLDADGRALIGSDLYLGHTGAASNKLKPSGFTTIWLAFGEGIEYSNTSRIQQNVVIAMSDGQDYQGSDTAIADPPASGDYTKVEMGSASVNQPFGYCPWTVWDVMGQFDFHWGKYFGTPTTDGYWYQQDFGALGSKEDWAYGLLQAPMPVYTIGLSLETATTPADINTPDFDDTTYGGGTPPVAPLNQDGYDVYVGPEGNESGTPEFNLWRIANTSAAKYYYASSPDDLVDIFTSISMEISSGFNQTRSPDPVGTRAVHYNSDKRAVTKKVDLTDLESARLSFWHKYNILQGGNGAFLQVAYKDPTVDGDGDGDPTNDWDYRYIIPPGEYTGMLYYEETIVDDFGNLVQWCWNGLCGSGSLAWDYVDVDILPFVPEGAAADGHVYRSEVKVAFNYTQFGGGTGMGWYLDDVKLIVSRDDATAVDEFVADVWALNNSIAHSGNYSWGNIDPTDNSSMKPGVDNILMTTPIDLTNAKNAYLSAYLKFNLNVASGSPPDGFRIDISSDNGVTWSAINLGVRSSWGVSGTGTDNEDGNATDGKAYTGLPESGNVIADDYWVNASSLSRLNIDLSAWIGNQILIRFRVVNNNFPDLLYRHNNNDNYPDPGFGGFFIDDVIVYGETIF